MATRDDTFQKKLLETFRVEADEHLGTMATLLVELEKSPPEERCREIVETVFREVHSLKGAARAVNFSRIVALCQPAEDVLAALKESSVAPEQETMDLLHEVTRELKDLLGDHGTGETDELIARLSAAAAGVSKRPVPAKKAAAKRSTRKGDRPPAPPPAGERRRRRGAARGDTKAAKEPPAARSVRVSTAKLDSLFGQAEELIAAKLAAAELGRDLREIVDQARARSEAAEGIRAQAARTARRERGADTSFTGLMEALDEHEAAVEVLTGRLQAAADRAGTGQRMLAKLVDNLIEDAKDLLMLPLSALFEMLPSLVRGIARDQEKEVELILQGGTLEIDRRIQEELKDPLLHIVRNAIDHGIEKPETREQLGKPPRGAIRISVSEVEGGKAEIAIADDGAGIDYQKLVETAHRLGLATRESLGRMDEQETARLLFRSGISTSAVVSEISGRGLGLAIVDEKVNRLGGTIAVRSTPGAGTTFRIVVPLSLAGLRGVLVRAAGRLFAVPTSNVERVLRVSADDIRTIRNRETLRVNGHLVPLLPLAAVLGVEGGGAVENDEDTRTVMVLASQDDDMAFSVDEVLGEQELLLKGLGSQLTHVRNISGATTTGSGALIPVLNVGDLLKSGAQSSGAPMPEGVAQEERKHKSILVVEDSITARTLLKNILETAGYSVTTAVDGVDALTTMKNTEIDLVVSDVEMPRMDGFDLTARIRADSGLAELPVVLVTALDSREHREHGIDAGANAYIVKSDFDQSNLLEVIQRLI